MNIFFPVNQDLADHSAHALYCLRNAWWLAESNPDLEVWLFHPGKASQEHLCQAMGLNTLKNLHVESLCSLRRKKGTWGITLNGIYYYFLRRKIAQLMSPGDCLIVPSFPKLLAYLGKQTKLKRDLSFWAEVHQLAELDFGNSSSQAQMEWNLLKSADHFLATTSFLEERLRQKFVGKPVHRIPLATGFQSAQFSLYKFSDENIKIGYFGSLYQEQGVRWLVESWPKIQLLIGKKLTLLIVGGSAAETQKLSSFIQESDLQGIDLRAAVSAREIPALVEECQALIIPALPTGRMPYVALTKAYDYLAFRKPILAADLPSIRDVLTHEKEAWLFDPGNSLSLAEGLKKILNDPDLAEQLVLEAEKSSLNYSWKERSINYMLTVCRKS